MKFFRSVGSVVNTVGGGVVKAGVHVAGSAVGMKYPKAGEYIKDVGDTVVHSSQKVISNTAHFADGATNGLYGAAMKNETRKSDGWADVKTASTETVKGIAGGLAFTGRSAADTVSGAIQKDRTRMVNGVKNLGKVGAVGMFGYGVFDLASVDTVEAMELDTRNMALDGETHEVTGVPFEKSLVTDEEGDVAEGVFPVFEPAYEMDLPEDVLQSNDAMHIKIANLALLDEIQQNPQLADELGFTAADVENLKNPVTPEGYDWHYHKEVGRMQLVDEATHQQTGHTGGRFVWGGGTEMR